MAEVPNDVVELIIAVDLNPSDPEEPINVNDVKVNPKGEDGEEDWKKLTMQLLEAADIKVSSYDEAAEAVSEILQDDVEGESPFDKAAKKPESDSLKLPHLMGGAMMGEDEDDEDEE